MLMDFYFIFTFCLGKNLS